MKPLVIYHGNCADGFSAAWVFHNRAPDHYDFHAGVYGEAPPDVTGRDVYLVDFSYKRDVVKAMCETATCVTLIDHHVTAIEDLTKPNSDGWTPNNFFHYTDINRSGAMLAWEFFHPNHIADPPPLLLGHIQDRDLWRFKLPNTREISAAIFSYAYTFETWDKLMSATGLELLNMSVQGAAIERKHHKDIAELVKVTKRYIAFDDKYSLVRAPVCSLPHTLSSDAGHLMCEQELKNTPAILVDSIFAACYWDTKTHRVFSLRSLEGGRDVSEVAKHFGGGGHKHAAGFSVTRDHRLAKV